MSSSITAHYITTKQSRTVLVLTWLFPVVRWAERQNSHVSCVIQVSNGDKTSVCNSWRAHDGVNPIKLPNTFEIPRASEVFSSTLDMKSRKAFMKLSTKLQWATSSVKIGPVSDASWPRMSSDWFESFALLRTFRCNCKRIKHSTIR